MTNSRFAFWIAGALAVATPLAAVKAQDTAKLDEMVQAAQQMVDRLRPESPHRREALADALESLSDALVGVRQWDRAEKSQAEVIELRSRAYGANHWTVTNARLDLEHIKVLRRLGPEHLSELMKSRSAAAQLEQLFQEGKMAEALTIAQEVLKVRKRVLGEGHPLVAQALVDLGVCHEECEQYEQAEQAYNAALVLRRNLFGETHPKTAECYYILSHLLARRLNRMQPARTNLERALSIRKDTLGEEHPQTLEAYNVLGILCQEMADFTAAETAKLKTLEIAEKLEKPPGVIVARSLNNLGHFRHEVGDYSRAEIYFQRFLEIAEKELGPDHRHTAEGYNNLGMVYKERGDLDKAVDYLSKAIAILERTEGAESVELATLWDNLGAVHVEAGEFARAKQVFERALAVRRKSLSVHHVDMAESYALLGGLSYLIGDYRSAEDLLQKALQIRLTVFGPNHPTTGGDFDQLGVLYLRLHKFDAARQHLTQGLSIAQTVYGDEHAHTLTARNNLAMLHAEMAEFDRAESTLNELIAIHERISKSGSDSPATLRHNLASVYHTQARLGRNDRYRQSVAMYEEAASRFRDLYGDQHIKLAAVYGSIGNVQRDLGRVDAAETAFQRAVTITQRHFDLTSTVLSERQQLALAIDNRYQLDQYLSLAVHTGQFGEQAYRHVFAWKGAIAMRQRAARVMDDHPKFAPKLAELQSVASRLAQLALKAPDPQHIDVWRRQIAELSTQKEHLESELGALSAEYRRLKKAVTLEDLLASLPDDFVLVDYLQVDLVDAVYDKNSKGSTPHLLVFVIRKNKPIQPLDLGPIAPIAEAVDIWRENFGRTTKGRQAAALLRKEIWAPLEDKLAGAKTVLVSPDGPLGRLPFPALPGKQPDKYLIEEWSIVLLPVPQILPALIKEEGKKSVSGNLLLLGGVDYDRQAQPEANPAPPRTFGRKRAVRWNGFGGFSPLPATKGEVAGIEKRYKELFGGEGIATLEAAGATEEALRQSISMYQFVHLATHGFFAPPELRSALARTDSSRTAQWFQSSDKGLPDVTGYHPGLLSGLALAGANKPAPDGDDGILTAEEVATLNLSGLELAVLSACETGLGEVAGGEGLLGLQRAFQVAGARSVIASQWKVSDSATRDLMERFYDNLWNKEMDTLAALRAAQLWMLNNESYRDVRLRPAESETSTRTSPEFWAAFTLSGDWR